MVYLLLIILLVLFINSFFMYKKTIISPAFIFSFGFVFQAIWAVVYAKKWELGLHANTFLVISIGVTEFVLFGYGIHHLVKYIKRRLEEKNGNINENNIKLIKINMGLEIIYLIFMIFVIIFYLYNIVNCVGGNYESISAIMQSISKYDNLLKFSNEDVGLPFIITNLRELVIASGYWFIYVVINNFLCNKKINIIELLIICVSLIAAMMDGSRTVALMMITSSIVIFVILKEKIKNTNNIISWKLIRNMLILGVLSIIVFLGSAKLWGRGVDNGDTFSYLSIYCGAEVKNLDLFLQESNYEKNTEIWGSQTFYSFIQTLGKKIGFSNFEDYKLDLPFREVNGINLGNVYTTFYPYIYDFGYVGEFILVLIMTVISQLIYESAKASKFKKSPNLSILIYINIFNCLMLSFFSNKFYENIFSMKMIKHIVFCIVLNCVFCTIDYKKIARREKNENRCCNSDL